MTGSPAQRADKQAGVADAVAAIDELIEQLKRPLSAADRADYWDDADRVRWLCHFEELRERLVRGEAPTDEQYHLARWLDFEGKGLGPLADQMSTVQRVLWDVFATDEDRAAWNDTYTGREARRTLRELGVIPLSRLRRVAPWFLRGRG